MRTKHCGHGELIIPEESCPVCNAEWLLESCREDVAAEQKQDCLSGHELWLNHVEEGGML